MSIYYGNKNIADIYYGSKKIKEVYKGSKLIYSKPGVSYIILTDDTRIDFESDNTPINNFSGPATSDTTITINGINIVRNLIKEIHFGNSYNDVIYIGDWFLVGCINLTTIMIPKNVTSIGYNFLNNCTSLSSVTIPENVTIIMRYLFDGTSLTTLKMEPFTPPETSWLDLGDISLIQVPCGSETLYKSAVGWSEYLNKIEEDCSIDSYWTDNYNNVHHFNSYNTPIENFYGWRDKNIIINGETVNKDNVKEIYFGGSYRNVTSIGDYFLYSFDQTSVINLSGLSNVTSVGDYFLGYAWSITSMDLSVFNLNSIGKYFMSGAKLLTSINLSGLSNVTTIGNYFLEWCENLISIDLSPLSNVTNIGNYFLYFCHRLESIDLSPLSNVTSIGNYFLDSCIKLPNIDFSPLSNVTTIGNSFLKNTRFSVVDLSLLSNLTNIGFDFLCTNKNLNKVIMGSIIPPILDDTPFDETLFGGSNNVSLLQVPCGSENAYKTANNWSSKADLIEGDC